MYLDCLGQALRWGLTPSEGAEPVLLGQKLTPSEREAPGYEEGPVCDSQVWPTSFSFCHILLPVEAAEATTFVRGKLEKRERLGLGDCEVTRVGW